MLAYRLVNGHWRVQTGLAGIGEERTVTTAGITGLPVVTGWEKPRPEWVDVAWLAMRVHLGRVRVRGGGAVMDVAAEEDPPRPETKSYPPPKGTQVRPPPPQGPAYRHPRGAGGT